MMESASLEDFCAAPGQEVDSNTDKRRASSSHETILDKTNEGLKSDINRSGTTGGDVAENPSSHAIAGTEPSALSFTRGNAQPRNESRVMNSVRSATSTFSTGRSFATARSSIRTYITARTRPSFATTRASIASYLTTATRSHPSLTTHASAPNRSRNVPDNPSISARPLSWLEGDDVSLKGDDVSLEVHDTSPEGHNVSLEGHDVSQKRESTKSKSVKRERGLWAPVFVASGVIRAGLMAASIGQASKMNSKRYTKEEAEYGARVPVHDIPPSWQCQTVYGDLVEAIEQRLLQRDQTPALLSIGLQEISIFRAAMATTLDSFLRCKDLINSLEPAIDSVTREIEAFKRINGIDSGIVADEIRNDVALEIYIYALKKPHLRLLVPSGILTGNRRSISEWHMHLHSRGMLPNEASALDWSGRGQHAEYSAGEETLIPLVEGKVLGHSMSAVVQSVQCRRIRLARKTICCTRRLTKEMAVTEVQHLQLLQHQHIIRIVGTYTLKKNFAILLYPAAQWNLNDFLDEYVDGDHALTSEPWSFFGCLSHAMAFIHQQNVKHMDIKPANILVDRDRHRYRVYIADFGIARAYTSAAESYTDSPTPFTRIYAAPEVARQDPRGFPADIFSLGCVFLEIMEALSSRYILLGKESLVSIRKGENTSFATNLNAVLRWCDDYHSQLCKDGVYSLFPERLDPDWILLFKEALDARPELRPSAEQLKHRLSIRCGSCDEGPIPFEAATPHERLSGIDE